MGRIPAILLLFLCMTGCDSRQDKILIATAANVQFAMEELVMEFEKETGYECTIILGSSGKLATQIRQGAPYHLFVSADMFYPVEIQKSGFSLTEPVVYARGSLVLWTMDTLAELTEQGLINMSRIAAANPKTAPYGKAARQYLDNTGMLHSVGDKLVFGESISQTNQFIMSRAVQAGFTARSVVLSEHIRGKGKWVELDQDKYDPIEQGIVQLRTEDAIVEKAAAFLTFITSSRGREILTKNGYNTP